MEIAGSPELLAYPLVARGLTPDSTVIEVRGRRIGDGFFGLIAGPCTVETREQTLETARAVAAAGATVLRGGAYKPRTSPYAFQGLGPKGLEILAEARDETGLPIVTELLDPRDVAQVAEVADVIQIGARNMHNFNLLAEVGRVPKPVLLKRAPSATVEELLMAAEYVAKEGNERVLLCERGIKTFERSTRYTLDLSAVPVLKRETHLPVLVDPSHAAGRSDLVLPLARAAVAAGADGVMVEVHPQPEDALCDGPQQIRVGEFARFADEIRTLVALMGKTVGLGNLMRIEPVPALVGHIAVPGDKSISHRAVLIGSVCEEETLITGFGRSADTEATIAAVRALGVDVVDEDVDALRVHGVGLRGLRESGAPIDCGNAGTLMRLLAGLLAGQEGRRFELVGDESLSARPMERVAEPLRRMGATVETTEGHAPLVVEGAPLRAIDYELPVASAQVKSASLLAGVQAAGRTTVVEPIATRDHTERLLERAGAGVTRRPSSVTVEPADELRLPEVEIPGDISSAAPFLVAAVIVPGSSITVHGVGLNPRRTGLLDVLEHMGAKIAIYNRRAVGGEPAGDVEVRASELVGATISAAEVPALVDELPLLAVVACHARGETVVRGAGELRAKESDRLEAVVEELRRLGGHIRATRDGFRIKGVPARLRGGVVDSRGDHRLAMLGAVAGIASREGVELRGAGAVATSFPGFFEVLEQVAPGAVHYPPAT